MSFSQIQDLDINNLKKSTVSLFLDNEDRFGSGFIIDDGVVVTNYHVIEGITGGFVVVNGTNIKHDIKGYIDIDDKTDLSLLSVPSLRAKPLLLSDEVSKPNDDVFIFQNPALTSANILEGEVIYSGGSNIRGIIKTSVPVSQGNSGSALLNDEGQVIGIISLLTESEYDTFNSGIAIDVSFLKRLLYKEKSDVYNLNILKNAYHYLSESHIKFSNKNYEGALIDLNTSIDLNPDVFFSYYNRANVKIKLGDFNGSIDDSNKAIDIIPNFALAYFARGLARVKLKDLENGLSDFNKVISIDDKFAFAYIMRGLIKYNIDKENLTAALSDLNKGIALDIDNGFFYINRGGLHYFSGNKVAACIDFKRALSLGHKDASAAINKFCK